MAVPFPLLTRQTFPVAASRALTQAASRAPPPRMVPESNEITEEKALWKTRKCSTDERKYHHLSTVHRQAATPLKGTPDCGDPASV